MAPRGGHGEHGQRIGLAAHEVARALDRIDRDIGLEGRARAAEPLAALRLRRLAARGLADGDDRIDIDLGQRGPHGVERRAAGIETVAPPDPAEGGAGGGLRHAAEGKDKFRIGRSLAVCIEAPSAAIPVRIEPGASRGFRGTIAYGSVPT